MALLLCLLIPESPTHFVNKNQLESAKKSIAKVHSVCKLFLKILKNIQNSLFSSNRHSRHFRAPKTPIEPNIHLSMAIQRIQAALSLQTLSDDARLLFHSTIFWNFYSFHLRRSIFISSRCRNRFIFKCNHHWTHSSCCRVWFRVFI